MKPPRKLFFLTVTFFFCYSTNAALTCAATYTAASVSYADVRAAVVSASVGDTVVVPAGEASWNSNLTITKGINLQGSGSERTIITSGFDAPKPGDNTTEGNFLIVYRPDNPASNDPFRISGFTFDFNNRTAGILLKNESTVKINKIRLDHNILKNANYAGGSARAVQIKGTVYGVIDNNTLTGNRKNLDSYGLDATSWNNFTFSFGSADNIYYEDNTIVGDYTNLSGGIGGRYCARYNTFIYNRADEGLVPWFDMHGNQGATNNYAIMGAEIYGNKVTSTENKSIRILYQRGGKAVVFYNDAVSSYIVNGTVIEEVLDSSNPTSNMQPQHVTDSYYWNNRKNGKSLVTITEQADCCRVDIKDTCINSCNEIEENRDFYNQTINFDGSTGVGCGTLANRPATCTPGVAYWATNQSCDSLSADNIGANPRAPISGTLYKCTSKNLWTVYYTPYTYPHPLRQEDKKLSAPSNLRTMQ